MAKQVAKGVVTLDSKDKVKGIQDDEFFYTKDELQAVRLHKGMYISTDQTDGAVHLFKEILANAIDECTNKNPHWDKNQKRIHVIFNQPERRITVIDNGRGFPIDVLVDAVMKKHASTKTVALSTSRNKKVTGLNGVGLTVTAALTDYMAITTYRGNHSKKIELFDGELKEHPVEPLKTFKTGSEVEIIPSEKYLGPIDLTNDIIEDYVRNMSYVLDPDIEITLTMLKDAGSKNPHKWYDTVWKAQGLAAAVNYMSSSLEFPPVEAKFVGEDFDLSVAFSYDRSLDDNSIASFGNYVITTEGGCHETAAVRAISEYFNREAKRQDPKSKYEVVFDDCKRGLVLAVNLEHISPKFEGQHKTKVSNSDVLTEGKKGLYQAIYNVMNNNPNLLKKAIMYLRSVAKARQESHKIKGVATKRNTTFLEDAEIEKYFTVSNRNSTGYKELYLAEGDSAAGGILNCRNAAYQAVYTVQGVTDNVHDLTLTQLLQKKTFKELITILGTGIGKDFDINKLRYNKVIICTDSDIDGSNITSLLLCFFFKFMPELIRAGYLYKAMPPLYLMDLRSLRRFSNSREWLYDKNEYYHMLNSIICDNCEFALELPQDGKRKSKNKLPEVRELTRREAMAWLTMNSEYRMELDNLGKKAACDPRIVEMICYMKLKYPNQMDFKEHIEELYPEMSYNPDTYSLIGSVDGQFFTIICDRLFDKTATRFMEELRKNECFYVWYRNKKRSEDKMTRATIGEFMETMATVFDVKIEQRFKGLGEAESDLLFKTTTNPKYRKLLQISIKDAKKATEILELLHGKSVNLRQARRDLIDSFKLSYADIDN